MRNYTWTDRRSLPVGSNWLKLGVISSERILRSRGCEEDLGRRDPRGSGRIIKTKVNRRPVCGSYVSRSARRAGLATRGVGSDRGAASNVVKAEDSGVGEIVGATR